MAKIVIVIVIVIDEQLPAERPSPRCWKASCSKRRAMALSRRAAMADAGDFGVLLDTAHYRR